LGTLWTIGVMRPVGLSFNLANVWALPLIIGAAAEYGLNVVLRYQEAASDGGPGLGRSTIMAVLLNGLTTISGFGSLMVARHQGIFSIGLLLTIGAVAGLAARTTTAKVEVRRAASLVVLVSVVFAMPFAVAGRAAAGEPTEQVQAAVTELYRLLGPSSSGSADRRQREEGAAVVLDRLFDWRSMARQALQHHWDERTPPERDEFIRLFADVFRHAYLARMSLV